MIFSSDKDATAVQTDCETLIIEQFGLNIAVAILTVEERADALAHAPDWWGNDPDSKHNAILVIPPVTAEVHLR